MTFGKEILMPSRLLSSVILFGSLVLPTCRPAPAGLSEADLHAIQAASDEFTQYLQAKDWDALGLLYTEDAILMPPNQAAVQGRRAIRDWMAASPVARFTLTNDDIEGVGDLAYVRGRYAMTLALEGSPVDSGKYVEIRRKQPDGSWKFSVDIFNSNLPPPTPQ